MEICRIWNSGLSTRTKQSILTSPKVEQYPILRISRTKDWGYVMQNNYVVMATVDPVLEEKKNLKKKEAKLKEKPKASSETEKMEQENQEPTAQQTEAETPSDQDTSDNGEAEETVTLTRALQNRSILIHILQSILHSTDDDPDESDYHLAAYQDDDD